MVRLRFEIALTYVATNCIHRLMNFIHHMDNRFWPKSFNGPFSKLHNSAMSSAFLQRARSTILPCTDMAENATGMSEPAAPNASMAAAILPGTPPFFLYPKALQRAESHC